MEVSSPGDLWGHLWGRSNPETQSSEVPPRDLPALPTVSHARRSLGGNPNTSATAPLRCAPRPTGSPTRPTPVELTCSPLPSRWCNLIGGGELTRERVEVTLQSAARTLTVHLTERDLRRVISDGNRPAAWTSPGRPPNGASGTPTTPASAGASGGRPSTMRPSPGPRGRTRSGCSPAFALEGMNAGKLDIRLSIRRASDVTGLGTNAVHDRMKRGGAIESHLQVVGQRSRPGDDRCRQATTWRPKTKRVYREQDLPSAECSASRLSRKTSLVTAAPSTWHRRGNAWRIHGLLSANEDTTVTELVEVTGLSPAGVRANLKHLAERGLADRVHRTTWRGTTNTVDERAPRPMASTMPRSEGSATSGNGRSTSSGATCVGHGASHKRFGPTSNGNARNAAFENRNGRARPFRSCRASTRPLGRPGDGGAGRGGGMSTDKRYPALPDRVPKYVAEGRSRVNEQALVNAGLRHLVRRARAVESVDVG